MADSDRRYGYKDLLGAYLAVHTPLPSAEWELLESAEYWQALKAHHQAKLAALEKLFGLTLSPRGAKGRDALGMRDLFESTVRSYAAQRTPWSGYLEAGLILRAIDDAGALGRQVMETSDRIKGFVESSREAHVEMLGAIVRILLGDRAGLTFSEDDLRGAGADPVAPRSEDYPGPFDSR